MKKNMLHLIAIFCIYLIIDISIAHAAIIHDPVNDITVGDRSANIKWTTDDSGDSTVYYGTTTGLGSSEANDTLGSSHEIDLLNLEPGITYYYSLASTNESGDTTVDDNSGNYYSFTTAADTAPPQVNVSLPEYHNAPWIGFTGITDPDSIIQVYVNRDDSATGTANYDNKVSSDSAGIFVIPRVNLPEEKNTVAIWIRDPAGNTNSRKFTIIVDLEDPEINLSVIAPGMVSDTQCPTSGGNFSLDHLPSRSPSASLEIKGTTSEPVNITYTVNNDTQEMSAETTFDFTLTLDETIENLVTINFVDKANNVVRYQEAISVDAQPPMITYNNLPELTPSYVQNVVIRGNASRPNLDIIVYVNNKTKSSEAWSTSFLDAVKHYGGLMIGTYEDTYTTTTDSNGEFELEVFLTQDIVSDTAEWDLTQQSDMPTPQPIQAPPGTTTVTGDEMYGRAYGVPSVWDNNIKIVAVDKFGRCAVAEGIISFAKCGIGGDWNINTEPPTPSVITPDHLTRGLAELSFTGELEWQGPGEDEETGGFGARKRPTIESIIVRKYPLSDEISKKFAIDPRELSGAPSVALDPVSGRTFYVIIPLNQINYTQKDWKELRDDISRDDIEVMIPIEIEINYFYEDDMGNTIRRVQKQCMDVRTILDIKIPPEVIPDWLLEDAIDFLDKTLELIENLLEPLKQITLGVFVTCLLSWVVYFVMLIQEKIQCAGVEVKDEPCYSATEKLIQTKLAMHWICDRVFCPAVPMVNKYIKDAGNPEGKGEDEAIVCDRGKANDLSYIKSLKGEPSIRYDQAVATEMDCMTGEGDPGKCCGQLYMDAWDSACVGISNELDESKCLLASESGDRDLSSEPECQSEIKNMLRSVSMSDICKKGKDNGSNIDYIESGMPQDMAYCRPDVKGGQEYWQYCNQKKKGEMDKGGTDSLIVSGTPSGECPGYLGTYNGRNVYIVPMDERNLYSNPVPASVLPFGENVMLYSSSEGISKGTCVSGTKSLSNCAVDTSSGIIYELNAMVGPAGAERYQVTPAYSSCKGKGSTTPAEMQADYHNTQKEYLINPTKGLVTSVMCVCLPAITGYLQLWWNILSQVKICLETILQTGDGSAGVCRAVLSMYVCDVIFKAIRCFVQLSGAGAGRGVAADYGTPGGFIKAASEAGSDIQSEITGRYGETGLYNTMFNEKKLMTSVCLWAFTGDFDFDIEGMLTGGGAIPLETKVFLFPHERRFMSSNPLNRGYATWIYHIGVGMAAGSDIQYHVYLVCSATNDCNPAEGFLGGKCDCAGKGETPLDITYEVGGGFLRAGEMIGPTDGDVYVKVRDQPVRYDKVRLVWQPAAGVVGVEGGTIEEKITQEGGDPPAECQFDLLGAEFRCGFAVGDIGYAAFTRPPQLSQTEPYKIGDRIMAEASIDKRSPGYDANDPAKSNPANQVPFFLRYVLYDGSKALTHGNIAIIPDGTKTYTVPPEGFEVTESMIMGYFTGGTYQVADVQVSGMTRISAVVTGQDNPTVLSDFYVKFKSDISSDDNQDAIISKTEVCEGTIEQTDQGRQMKQPNCNNRLTRARVRTGGDKLILEYNGIEIKEVSVDKAKKDTYFIVDYTEAQTTTTKSCDEAYDLTTPKQLKLRIGLYRCARIDEAQPYSSTNCGPEPSQQVVEYYGQVQEYELPVQVVCSETSEKPLCPNDQIATVDCDCGGSTAKAGKQFCHTDWTTQQRAVYDYKSCTFNAVVPGSGTSVKVKEGSGEGAVTKYYCGCRSDGSVEDCTNRACTVKQGVPACRQQTGP